MDKNNNNQHGHLSFEEMFVPTLHHMGFIIVLSLTNDHLAYYYFANKTLNCHKWSKAKFVWTTKIELIKGPKQMATSRAQHGWDGMYTIISYRA